MNDLTVIIPCYNAKKYIKRCLDSMGSQTMQCFTVLLIDDCSTDDTYEWVDTNKGSYQFDIIILKNDKNMGPSLSRRKGIEFAKTPYISFCDADDTYSPNFVSTLMQEAKNSDCDISFCGFTSIVTKREKQILTEHQIVDSYLFSNNHSEMLCLNIDSLCIGLYRRGLFDSIDFPDIRNGEDMAILPILLAKASSISCISKCEYNYYYHSSSASMNSSIRVVESLKRSFSYVEEHLIDSYRVECEYIGIRNFLYGAILNLFKTSANKHTAEQLVKSFEDDFPEWHSNSLCKKLPIYKRFFLFCIYKRMYFALIILTKIHSWVVGN